jgi:hypothetical protein
MTATICQCGSPMSYFEEENYQKCGACHQKETKEAREKEQVEANRKEEERKAREEREAQEKRAKQRTLITDTLKKAAGKTISRASVIEWTDVLGDQEAESIELIFTDESTLRVGMEHYSYDGDSYRFMEIACTSKDTSTTLDTTKRSPS